MSGDPSETRSLQALKHSLQALAQPAEVQCGFLPPNVTPDELALSFDNARRVVIANDFHLTDQQRRSIDSIDKLLEEMSQSDCDSVWTDDGLLDSDDWQRIRKLAAECLAGFGWPNQSPPKGSW